jgi:hypothetical protein
MLTNCDTQEGGCGGGDPGRALNWSLSKGFPLNITYPYQVTGANTLSVYPG